MNAIVHGLFLLCLTAVFAAGCARIAFQDIKPGIEQRGHYIEQVPFVKQPENQCGPAALAGVFAYYGRPVELNAVIAAVYLPKLGGTLPMDMERFAREQSFRVSSGPGTIASLTAALRTDAPVICLLDLGFSIYRQPHYVTVVGFDDVKRALIMHDGIEPDRVMTYERFEHYWDRAGDWMLVIKP